MASLIVNIGSNSLLENMRSFSTLRRLKTWGLSHMGEERITGIALLNIPKNILINDDNIISKFRKIKQKRLNFVI
jgi:hypothetical protein